MMQLLAIFIGGGLGSLARFGISRLVALAGDTVLPWATLGSNLLSTALLAWFMYKSSPQGIWFFAIAIGFCGGFSTFSTFSYETFQLIRNDQWAWAIANVMVSVVACLIVLFVLSKIQK